VLRKTQVALDSNQHLGVVDVANTSVRETINNPSMHRTGWA
jgi:hypothetical protein